MEEQMDEIRLSPDYFLQRQAEAAQFADQNTRYDELLSDPTFDESDVADFRLLGEDGLYQEQLETRGRLLKQDNSAYLAITPACDAKAAELMAAKGKLETITDQEDARKSRLLSAAKRVIELSPYAEFAATKLAQEKISAIEHLDREGLRERVDQLSKELGRLGDALAIASEAWPVPKIIRDYELDSGLGATSADILVEDEIPVDPATLESASATERKLIKRHGQTPYASIQLAGHLMDNSNTIFLPEELGEHLYTDESHFADMTEIERSRCISGRVERRLNQHEQVKPMLEDEGYRLQYGWRRFVDSRTGISVHPKRRIYRAIELSQQPDAPHTFEEIVYTNKNPEAITPPVGSSLDQPGNTAEAIDAKEAELAGYARKVIEQLWSLELLPDQADDIVSARSLRLRVLRQSKHAKGNPMVKTLLAKVSSAQEKFGAADIVITALDKRHQPHYSSQKEYKKVSALVTGLLEAFYESLSSGN